VRIRHVTLVAALVAVAALAVTSAPSSEAATKPSKRNAATLCASPPGTRTGAMQSTELVETSGLAWSRRDRDLLWAHNDSGDTARVFALGLDGRDRGTVVVDGAAAVDWEDIALQRGPGKQTNVIWAGDVGDNASGRAEIVVYRFSEPDPPGPGKTTHTIADMITLQYADRPHDAEAMIVDDRTGDLVIITKEPQPPAGVFVARAATLEPGAPVVLERAGDLTLAASPVPDLGVFAALATLVTGADATGHGRAAAVRSYGGVSLYAWPKGTSLTEALSGPACAAPAPFDLTHPQGEAIALSPDGRAYATASEGAQAPIVVVGTPKR
jgi:hypothetical protein